MAARNAVAKVVDTDIRLQNAFAATPPVPAQPQDGGLVVGVVGGGGGPPPGGAGGAIKAIADTAVADPKRFLIDIHGEAAGDADALAERVLLEELFGSGVEMELDIDDDSDDEPGTGTGSAEIEVDDVDEGPPTSAEVAAAPRAHHLRMWMYSDCIARGLEKIKKIQYYHYYIIIIITIITIIITHHHHHRARRRVREESERLLDFLLGV